MLAPVHNTPLAYLIVLAIVLCSIHALTHRSFFESWRMHPYSIFRGNRMFTVLTSLFVHVDGMHLLINTGMLCLTLPEVEYMLVDDFGPVKGRLLLVFFILFTAVFAGAFTAVQNRNKVLHWSTGSSALIMAMVLYFLMYFPVEPLNVGSSMLPMWLPVWLALGILIVLLFFMLFKTPASAIHLYGALAGVLFAFAVRPQAINEVTDIICPLTESEKGNDESSRYNHSGEHSEYCTIEKSTFAAFASLNSI